MVVSKGHQNAWYKSLTNFLSVVRLIMGEEEETVVDALIACGIDNVALFMGQTQAACIAVDAFIGSLSSC
jgi:hypothetical protein